MQLMRTHIKEEITDLADYLQKQWKRLLASTEGPFHVALSGGSTPLALFDYFKKQPLDLPWERIHFWWGDERLVDLESPESNGGEAYRRWLKDLPLKKEQLHLAGGFSSEKESLEYYRKELFMLPRNADGLPYFHWIWLGLGDDGHCASLFPDFKNWDSKENILICKNPYSGQARISFTPSLISRAIEITFIVRGAAKAPVLREILTGSTKGRNYPAGRIAYMSPAVEWLCDEAACPNPDGVPDRD